MSDVSYGVWRVTHSSEIRCAIVNLFVASSLTDLAKQWLEYCGDGDDYIDPDTVECIAHENELGDDPKCAGFKYPEFIRPRDAQEP